MALSPPGMIDVLVISSTRLKIIWENTDEYNYIEVWENKNGDGYGDEPKFYASGHKNFAYATNLDPNIPYCYKLIGGTWEPPEESGFSGEECATTYGNLYVPGDLVTTAFANFIEVTFKDNSATEDDHRLERKVGAGDFAEYATIPANVEYYKDTSVTPGETYTYRAKAKQGESYSDPSNEDSAVALSVPSIPTNPTLSEVTNKEMRFSWTAPAADEDAPVTGYKVQISDEDTFGGEETEYIVGAGVLDFLFRELTPNDTYYARVCTYNGVGDSSFTASVNDITDEQYEPTEFEKFIRKPGIELVALCEMNLGKEFKGFPFMKDDDLVGCWPLDETSGMVAYDKSKSGNNGSLENMTEEDHVDGKVGKALDLDGEDDCVDCGKDESLDITDEITVTAWIYPRTLGEEDYGRIVDKKHADAFMFAVYNTNRLALIITGTIAVSTNNVVTLNEWNHVAFTYHGTDREGKFYVNGEEAGDIGDLGAMGTSVQNLYIGNRPALDRAFDGLIDEVRIYKRALTEDEVKQLHDTPGHRIHEIPVTDRAIVDFEKFYENGDEYTKKASKAQVQANASSFYLHPSTRKLYIHTSAEDNPSAFYTEGRFILHIKSGESATFNGNFYYPLLSLDNIPSMSSEVSAFYGGSFTISAGTISLKNDEKTSPKFFDKRYADYLWRGGKLVLKIGGPGFSYEQYKEAFTSLIDREGCTDKLFGLNLMDLRANLEQPLPMNKYWLTNFPDMDEDQDGKVIPKAFGYIESIVPACTNKTNKQWKFHDTRIKEVHTVIVNDVEKTKDTDYYVDYQRGIVTFNKDFSIDWEKDIIEIHFTGIVNSANEPVADGTEIFRHIMLDIIGLSLADLDHDSIYQTKYASSIDLAFSLHKEGRLTSIIHKLENSVRASTFQDEKARIGLQIAQTVPPSSVVHVENFHIAKDGHSQEKGSSYLFKEINVFYKEYLEEGKMKWEVFTKALPEFVWKYGKKRPLKALNIYTYFYSNTQASALADDIATKLTQLEAGFIHETLPWLLYGCRAGDLIKLSRNRFYNSSGTADEITVRLLKLDKMISSKQSAITGVVVS